MKLLLVTLLAFTSASSFAAAKSAPAKSQSQPQPSAISHASSGYGMAGCGLGSLVFKENDKTQILAATTNGTFGSQTFGITFGTSNCGDSGKLVSKEQVEQYIAVNQNSLKNDISRGNGEALNGLAELMGQKNSAVFKSQLKSNYAKIFAKSDLTSQQITENLYHVMN